jgi:hypothetical protein
MVKSGRGKADSWMPWKAKASTEACGARAAVVAVEVQVAALAGLGVLAGAVVHRPTRAPDMFREAHLAPGLAHVHGSDRAVAVYHRIVWRQMLAKCILSRLFLRCLLPSA